MNRTLKQSAVLAAFGKGTKGRLVVNAAKASEDPVEILLIGPVGASWWSEEGIRQKEVIDAIEAVPVGKKIVLGINSTGGNVEDGLGIYNAIRRRSADIIGRNDGYACSIASAFILAAGRVITPKASVWMIHNAWLGAVGDSEEMRQTAAMLERHDAVLAAIYAEHTGKTREECAAAMAQETWFTGEEAHAWGLASEMSDDEIELEPIESSPFAAVPPSLVLAFGRPSARLEPLNAFRRVSPPAPAARHQSDTRNNETSNHNMNRIAILALLKKHGANLPDNASDADLQAEGLKLITAGKITLADYSAAAAPAQAAQPQPQPQQAAAAPAPVVAHDPAIANRLAALETQNAALRRADVTRRVDAAIAERRIPTASREFWITQGVADASALEVLASYPPHLPGEAPVVEITAEAPTDILAGIEGMRSPMAALCRGERVQPADIRRNAVAITKAVRAGGERLIGAMNASTVTISSDLKLNVLLAGSGISAFRRRVLAVSIFSTRFNDVPLQGTNKVAVPYFPRFSTASQDFVQASGYVTPGDRTVEDREVTVNKRKYQLFQFNSAEMARQPFFNLAKFTEQSAEQLGVDVFTDVLSAVTIANFATAVITEQPDAFNTDDITDIAGACDTADWPQVGRNLVLDIPYKTALLKDPDLKNVDKSGSDAALRQGSLGSLAGFSDIYANNRIPTNSEKLRGFVTLPQSLLVATSPIMPAPGVRKQLVNYAVVTDPETGLSFEYRYWGNAQMDEDSEVIEANYGYGPGDGSALFRITNP